MPVRGLVRSKIWFSFKIGAINVKRVLNRVLILRFYYFSKEKIRYFLTFIKMGKESLAVGA